MDKLKEFFSQHNEIALAFSGGTDSSYLLYAAKKYAKKVKAYYVKSDFQPEFEFEDAKRLARELDADLRIIEIDVLQNQEVVENSKLRCYYCKNVIFSKILETAKADGFTCVIDGTNASDDEGDRPGMRALKEMQVLSPLRLCGITKSDVREFSKKAGLFTWDKPSYACLATRIPTDVKIKKEDLKKVEMAEDGMFLLGFKDFRVRVYNGAAQIQLRNDEFELLLGRKEEVKKTVGKYFEKVFIDLDGR